MPSGKTHDKITLFTIPLVGIGIHYMYGNNSYTLLLLITYIFSSFMFNGDLDIYSKPYNRWFILKFIWLPYQTMFSHRSIFTHGIIIGTIVRLVYISPLILGILYFFNLSLFNINEYYLITILCGLELGSSIHTISDYIF